MDRNKNKNENRNDDKQEKETEGLITEEKVEELEEKVREFEDKWKRALADYQNQEKWVREQRSEWVKSANRDLLLRILPVLDTLILAKSHSEDKSLEVSIDQFFGLLKDEGVIRIETIGKDFDPNLMEAISTEDGSENTVIRELRSGYMLHEKVLRPAQVTVGNGEIKN